VRAASGFLFLTEDVVRVVIFAAAQLASLAWYVLGHDSAHEVVGFTVDGAYLVTPTKHGLPVVPFGDLEKFFESWNTAIIAPVGLHSIKGLSTRKAKEAKARGCASISYVSSRAMTWPDLVLGEGSMIWTPPIISGGGGP
jgi:hypothetical protein